MNKQLMTVGALCICGALLTAASLNVPASARTVAQTTSTMMVEGACPPGLAQSSLSQAMMVAGMTMEATVSMDMTMDGTMMMDGTMEMAATSDATMSMDMTMDSTMMMDGTMAMDGTMMATSAVMSAPTCFVALLTGSTEIPGPGDADGFGIAAISVDPSAGTVTFDVAVTGITLPAMMSHIHKGDAAVAGPVVIDAGGAPDSQGLLTSTVVVTDTTLIQDILANPAGYYYNVHTSDYPDGAIRGQLTLITDMGMRMMPTMDATMSMDMTMDMAATADATAQ